MHSERYSRQTQLKEIGKAGQQKLADARVVVLGCGGLGSVATPYLAGAGVGHITLVDGDMPTVSNLHRQVFFATDSEHTTKSMAIAQHIQKLNSEIDLTVISSMLTKATITEVLADADLVLECTDSIQCKYLANDYCHIHRIPMIYGGIHQVEGYVSLFDNTSAESIHLRDIFPVVDETIPSCSEVGVLGTLAGIIGLLQANEAIKYLTGAGTTLAGTLLTYHALDNEQMKVRLQKSYNGDMKQTYADSSYLQLSLCDVPEITYQRLMTNRPYYTVVSILEPDEHQSLDEDVLTLPLSTLAVDQWQASREGSPTVFYCKSGKRSAALVAELSMRYGHEDVYSLKGGLMHEYE